jgi:hypothetical protein
MQTFGPARSWTAPARATGCPPPRMSSPLGCAQGSPLTSLRRAPGSPGLEHGRPSTREQPVLVGSGRRGALRSEIKEERRAQPASGDIRGAERPAVLISRHLTHARSDDCERLQGADRRDRRSSIERHPEGARGERERSQLAAARYRVAGVCRSRRWVGPTRRSISASNRLPQPMANMASPTTNIGATRRPRKSSTKAGFLPS